LAWPPRNDDCDMMDYPKRKHARYRWHDYNGGFYFITICTKDKQHSFGYIANNEIIYSEIGMVTAQNIDEISSHWKGVEVLTSVVMPNHVHMIICIDGSIYHNNNDDKITAFDGSQVISPSPLTATPRRGPSVGGFHSYLAVIIGGFKAGIKKYANQHGLPFEWQRGFHDHIIRDSGSFNKISDYINNNVLKWSDDCYNV